MRRYHLRCLHDEGVWEQVSDYLRPWHEIARLIRLDDPAPPEPKRADPTKLSALLGYLPDQNKERAAEFFCREENIKPAVMMAALRDQSIRAVGVPPKSERYLVFSGRMVQDDGEALMVGSVKHEWPPVHCSRCGSREHWRKDCGGEGR